MEFLDIDWFASDPKGRIIHFASGGGKLARHVFKNRGIYREFSQFLEDEIPSVGGVIVNPSIEAKLKFLSVEKRHRYLESFAKMASKGLTTKIKTSPLIRSNPISVSTSRHRPWKLFLMSATPRYQKNRCRELKLSIDRQARGDRKPEYFPKAES